MSRLKNHLLAASGFAILVVGLMFTSPAPSNAVPGPQDVIVVNPAAMPVPTAAQGITTISGNVNVTNPMANPVFSLGEVIRPFHAFANSTQSGNNVSTVDVATVPAGHRLVIEFVSMVGQVPPTQHVEILSVTTSTDPVGGVSHQLLINAQPAAVIGDAIFRASQEVRLYANPGTTVRALFRRNSGIGDATFGITISGRLVPVV
jgi:hypothetical protein